MPEQISVEKRPGLMQKIRKGLKKNWVKYGLGPIAAATISLGAVKNVNANPAPEPTPKPEPQIYYMYETQQLENASFTGHIIKGDDPWLRGFDFVLEDFAEKNEYGDYMRIVVRERKHPTNEEILNKLEGMINQTLEDQKRYPDLTESYPVVEVRGKFRPLRAGGMVDGELFLEEIVMQDQNGLGTLFFTDPAESSRYQEFDRNRIDVLFWPGSYYSAVYYPNFYGGYYPYFDFDMDGLPNWMDPTPFYHDGWWDDWVLWRYNPSFWGSMWALDFYWHTSPWFSWHSPWNWSWHSHGGGWGWYNSYWNYWGGWHHYMDDHDPGTYRHVLQRITKNQLQDRGNRKMIGDYMKNRISSRNLSKKLDSTQLRQLENTRNRITSSIRQKALATPEVVRKDSVTGKQYKTTITPRGATSPVTRGTIKREYTGTQERTGTTSRVIRRIPSTTQRGTTKSGTSSSRTTKTTKTPVKTIKKSSATASRSTAPKSTSSKSSSSKSTTKKVKKKKDSESSSSLYSSRNIETYPSRYSAPSNTYQSRATPTSTYRSGIDTSRYKRSIPNTPVKRYTPNNFRAPSSTYSKIRAPLIRSNISKTYRTPSRSSLSRARISSPSSRSYVTSSSRSRSSYSSPSFSSSSRSGVSSSVSKSSVSRSSSSASRSSGSKSSGGGKVVKK